MASKMKNQVTRIVSALLVVGVILGAGGLWVTGTINVSPTNPPATVMHAHWGSVVALAFSSDGERLASCGWDRKIKLWNVKTGQLQRELKTQKAEVLCLSFSPNGKLLASGGTGRTVRIWDLGSYENKHTLFGHNWRVQAVDFFPGNDFLVSASWDTNLRLWHIKTEKPKCLREFKESQTPLRAVKFSPDGTKIVSAGVGEIRLWDARSGKTLWALPLKGDEIDTVGFSSDGERIVTSSGKNIMLWNAKNGKRLKSIYTGIGVVLGAAFGADDKHILGATNNLWGGHIKIYDAKQGDQVYLEDAGLKGFTAVAFSNDGRLAATGGLDGTISIWSFEF
jgi:WD40 repeat protein